MFGVSRKLFAFSVLAASIVTAACGSSISATSAEAAPAKNDIKFKKTLVMLGGARITAELADTPDKRERGLMNRTNLKDTEGMLFVFETVQPLSFWMKDTLIPLSIGFFDESGKLFQVEEMESTSVVDTNIPTYESRIPGKFALEMPKGWFARHKIESGAQLKIPALHIPDR